MGTVILAIAETDDVEERFSQLSLATKVHVHVHVCVHVQHNYTCSV